ncbi:putative flavonol synthase [Helianthus annuus]|nr:putative flavonol synthase [Helianthus annuus]
MGCPCDWPEPVVRVQSLSENGESIIPERYIKPPSDRPTLNNSSLSDINIPLVDLSGLTDGDLTVRESTKNQISIACREWGFFQVINHGLKAELVDGVREIWREFFHEPMEVKQKYANLPLTYEGYGSRELVEEYSKEIVRLGNSLLEVFSINLGLRRDYLQNKFGGEDIGACLRVNFYPKCPQPDLTLGLSSHSDPGGITFLLPDENVSGLQVRRNEEWITVKPVRHGIIVNIGDQIQVNIFVKIFFLKVNTFKA